KGRAHRQNVPAISTAPGPRRTCALALAALGSVSQSVAPAATPTAPTKYPTVDTVRHVWNESRSPLRAGGHVPALLSQTSERSECFDPATRPAVTPNTRPAPPTPSATHLKERRVDVIGDSAFAGAAFSVCAPMAGSKTSTSCRCLTPSTRTTRFSIFFKPAA